MEVDLERLIKPGEHTFESKVQIGDEEVPLDQLARRPQGEALSRLVGRVQTPFVIALDGPWGTGKSHFLKLWCGSHSQMFGGKGEVVYFNAFAEDYLDDPLMALTRAIASRISYDDPEVLELAKNGLRLTLRAGLAFGFGALKGVANSLTGGAAGAALEGGIEAVAGLTDEQLAKIWEAESKRQDVMEAFRSDLAELAQTRERLTIVIDELDRCRPDYALSLLEVVKHAFSVEGVVFVFGVNRESLAHSVRKRYGVGVNGENYLQKFLSCTVRLPAIRNGIRTWEVTWRNVVRGGSIGGRVAEYAEATLNLLGQNRDVTTRDIQRVLNSVFLVDVDNLSDAATIILVTSLVLDVLAPELTAAFLNKELDYAALKVGGVDYREVDEALYKTVLYCWQAQLGKAGHPSHHVTQVADALRSEIASSGFRERIAAAKSLLTVP